MGIDINLDWEQNKKISLYDKDISHIHARFSDDESEILHELFPIKYWKYDGELEFKFKSNGFKKAVILGLHCLNKYKNDSDEFTYFLNWIDGVIKFYIFGFELNEKGIKTKISISG